MLRIVVVGRDSVRLEGARNILTRAVYCRLYYMRGLFVLELYYEFPQVGLDGVYAVFCEEVVKLDFLARHAFYFEDIFCVFRAEYGEYHFSRFVRVACEKHFYPVPFQRVRRLLDEL